jgi:hypothetical protein
LISKSAYWVDQLRPKLEIRYIIEVSTFPQKEMKLRFKRWPQSFGQVGSENKVDSLRVYAANLMIGLA